MATGQLIGRIGEPFEPVTGAVSGEHLDGSDSPGGFGVLQDNGGVTYEYVGKFGGGGQPQYPMELYFADVTSGFTVELPDGEWGLAFQFPPPTWNYTQLVRLNVDGVEAGRINGGSGGTRSENASIMVRHQTGSLDIFLTNAAGRVDDMTVVAFPDPTP